MQIKIHDFAQCELSISFHFSLFSWQINMYASDAWLQRAHCFLLFVVFKENSFDDSAVCGRKGLWSQYHSMKVQKKKQNRTRLRKMRLFLAYVSVILFIVFMLFFVIVTFTIHLVTIHLVTIHLVVLCYCYTLEKWRLRHRIFYCKYIFSFS